MDKCKSQATSEPKLKVLKPRIILKGKVKDKTLLKTQQCQALMHEQIYHSKTEAQDKYQTKKDDVNLNLQTPLQNDSLEIFNGSQVAKSFMLVTDSDCEKNNKIETLKQVPNQRGGDSMFKRINTILNHLQRNWKYLSSKKSVSKKYLSVVSKRKGGQNEYTSDCQERGLIETGSNITKFVQFSKIKQQIGKQPMRRIFSQKYSLISHSSNHRPWCRSQPITIFKQPS